MQGFAGTFEGHDVVDTREVGSEAGAEFAHGIRHLAEKWRASIPGRHDGPGGT
jgi:hypothetical protein